MRGAFTIAAKDLRLRRRDRSALILGIIAPFLVAFLLRLVLGGAEARADVEAGDLDAVFVVPEDFTASGQSVDPAEVRVIGNVDAQLATQIATAVAEGFLDDINAVRLAVA